MKKYLCLMLVIISALGLQALTLAEARQLALANNPELLAQEQATKSARTTLWQSYLNLIPSANVTGSYVKYDDPVTLTAGNADSYKNYGYDISQPIFHGGSIWLGVRITNDSYKISRNTLYNQKLATISTVESYYFTVLENRDLLALAKKNLENAEKNLEIGGIQYETGQLSKADYLNLQAEKASRDVSLISRENLYQTSQYELTSFLQLAEMPELEDIQQSEHTEMMSQLQSLDSAAVEALIEALVQAGINNNLTIKNSILSRASAQKSLLIAGGEFLPTVNLYYSKSWQKYDLQDDYSDSGQLGINFSIPIFPVVDNGLGVAKARHNLKKANYVLKASRTDVTLALQNAVLNLVTSAKTVKSAELSKEYARETYEQMRERFHGGMISTNELLAVDIMYSNAQNQYISGIYDFLRAKSTLLQQLGTEDESILNEYIK